VDPHGLPLAAYQVEVWDASRAVRIVGIEGGEPAAFRDPPRYDPAAMQNDRVILAAFNTGNELPSSRVRVARLHVAIEGAAEPEWHARLTVASSPDADTIRADVEISKGDGP